MKIKSLVAVGLSASFLSGCLPLFVGGAAVGYMSIQERGVKSALWDTKTKTHVKERLTSKRYQYASEVNVNVLHGSVLLTGVVSNPGQAVEAEKVARTVEGVEHVYNDLFTDGIYPTEQYAEDSWISTQLRANFIGAKDVNAANYQISVVNNEVYLMGLTSSNSERERVLHIARTVKGVQKVHNYVKLKEKDSPKFLGFEIDQ